MERKYLLYLLYTVLDERKTIAYARVSSCDPKEDLAINQVEAMVYEARI